MKQYSILDNSGIVTGHIQVDDNVPYSELLKVYPGLVEGFRDIDQSTVESLNTTVADQARSLRDSLLSAIDRVNPVWYASLATEQQQALVVYRQQLLDVPEQAGFPESVEWPAKPTWL